MFLACLFLSLARCFSNLYPFCSAGSKARFNFFSLSLLFCSVSSLTMMENKQLAMAVSENYSIWLIQGLWKSTRRPNPFLSRVRKIFRALAGYERTGHIYIYHILARMVILSIYHSTGGSVHLPMSMKNRNTSMLQQMTLDTI